MNKILLLASATVVCVTSGCIQLKTESEIKPIHITMDVNLKVDKSLDKAFADENAANPRGDFKRVRELLEKEAVGVTNRAMLEARAGATDDDRLFVSEQNTKRLRRFRDVAKADGAALEDVQRRQMEKMRTRFQPGCGYWVQADDGSWSKR